MATAEETYAPNEVAKFVSYDSVSGALTWKRREFGMTFGPKRLTDKGVRYFNTLYAGAAAGSMRSGGYMDIRIMSHAFLTHRVAWALYMGEWPLLQIDHINGVKTDNRIMNLRVVDAGENSRNFSRFRTNTSGQIGVHFDSVNQKWLASIYTDGRKYSLGRYAVFEDAVAVRKSAEKRLGFHPNHGKN
jgi:hypothetical protein